MTANDGVKNALEILTKCIENGNETVQICNDSPDTITANPSIRKFIENINDETKKIKAMRDKISDLWQSNVNQDYTKWKSELQAMVNSMESMSNENVNQIMEAIARSKISKTKRKFEKHEELVRNFKGDEATKNFANMLMSRNQKIINCLNHASSLLPKSLNASSYDESSRGNRKLFIFGEDMQRTMIQSNERKERLGTVTIQGEGLSSASTSSNTTTNPRQVLHGFIKEATGRGMEVILELIRPSSTAQDSTQGPKLSATLAIEGECEQNVEVYEINLVDMPSEGTSGPAVMAVIQNNATGNLEQIPMQMIPLTPGREIHGQIMELQAPNQEQLADITLNLVENSLGAAGFNQHDRTPIYLTPPKTPPAPTRNVQRARRGTTVQPRNISFGEELLDDVQMSLVDDSIQGFPPNLNLTNEQISQITMDLVEDFINESLPPISPTRQVPAFATGRRNLRNRMKDRSLNLGTPTRASRKAPLPRGLDIAFDRAADILTRSIIQEASENLEDIDLDLVSGNESTIGPNIPMQDLRTPNYLTPPKTPPAPSRIAQRRRMMRDGLQNRELDFGEEQLEDMNLTLAEDSLHDSGRFHLSNLTNEMLDDMNITMAPSFNESVEVPRRQITFAPTSPNAVSAYGTPPRRIASRVRDRSLIHGTPSRFPRRAQLVRVSDPTMPARSRVIEIPHDEEHLSQIDMDLVDVSMEQEHPEWMNARTPAQLTPPRTPQAPFRIAQRRRQGLPVRALNLSEEQLDDINLDLVDDSMQSPGRMFSVMSPNATQEHISQMDISFAPNFDESSIAEQASFRRALPVTSPSARTIYGTPMRRNINRNRDRSFHYGTPSRFPRSAQLPRINSPSIRNVLPQSRLVVIENDEQLADIDMDLIENEITTPERSPHRVMRTPIQLTPPRTPIGPGRRVLNRGTRYPLQIRNLNFSEEQLEDIQMDLINDSMQSPPGREFPLNMSQDEQLSQVNLTLDDSYVDNLTFFEPNQTPVANRFENSDLLQFSDRNSTVNQMTLGGARRRREPSQSPYRTVNRMLQEPMRNYLTVTPTPRDRMSRSFGRRTSPRSPQVRNTSVPSRLLYVPQPTLRPVDRSLNAAWQSAQRRNAHALLIPSAEFAPRIIDNSYGIEMIEDIEMPFASSSDDTI